MKMPWGKTLIMQAFSASLYLNIHGVWENTSFLEPAHSKFCLATVDTKNPTISDCLESNENIIEKECTWLTTRGNQYHAEAKPTRYPGRSLP
jgi:hypothetical protein